MLTPRQIIQEISSKTMYITSKEDAIAMFDAQSEGVKSIANTQGYKEIKLYWYRVREAAITRLDSIKSESISEYKAVTAEMKQAKAFIDFLDNLENTPNMA